MKNLRFWQKTYLLTLLLFLLALFGGIMLIGWQNQHMTMNREMEKARNEQRFIAQSLSRDLSAIQTDGQLNIVSLIRSYGHYYRNNGILIEVMREDELLFSYLPEYSNDYLELHTEVGTQYWTTREYGGVLYSLVSSRLSGAYEEYTVVCARSLEQLTEAWVQMRRLLTMGSISVSIVLAIGLFFILRSLSKPLERLASTANKFAEGNFSARAIKKGNDEIGELAESLNAMANTAERNIAEIQAIAEQNARMAANLSHEIRTPLTAIQGYAEYLQLAELTREEQSTALHYITEESARLQKISQRMLMLSSLEHDVIAMGPVKIVDIIDQVELSISPKAVCAGIELDIQSGGEGMVNGDAILLESLLLNLLDNSIKACAQNGKVSLTVKKTGKSIHISITDNGCGMNNEDLAKLGEPFYRPDISRSRSEGGAGLGVALCYQIAGLHNATLTYDSIPQKGTKVMITFTAL